MEVIVEKIIDDMLFKKDSWFKKFLRRIKCKSSCCLGSSCELEPEHIKEEKLKQKQEILDFVKIIKKNSNNWEEANTFRNFHSSHI